MVKNVFFTHYVKTKQEIKMSVEFKNKNINEAYKKVMNPNYKPVVESIHTDIMDLIVRDLTEEKMEQKRREVLTELLSSFEKFKGLEQKLKENVRSLMGDAEVQEIFVELNKVLDPESAEELQKLSDKFNELVDSKEITENKDKRRHFLDAVKKTMANFTDDEIKTLNELHERLAKKVLGTSTTPVTESKQVLTEAELADKVKTLVDAIKADEELEPSRRKIVADLVAEYAMVDKKTLANIQTIALDIASKKPHLFQAIVAMTQDMAKIASKDPQLVGDLMKLRVKLMDMIEDGTYGDKNKMFRFITALKKAIASIDDETLKQLYKMEKKLVEILIAGK